MTAATTPRPPAGPLQADAAALESILESLIAEHERLLTLAQSHRVAMSAADAKGIAAAIREQNQTVQRIAELETRRLALVTRLAPPPARTAKAPQPPPPTLSTVIPLFPAAARDRLAALGERLRNLLTRLRREHAVICAAAESLAAHMDGLMRQIGRRLANLPTYARPGAPDSPATLISAVDLTT